MAQPTTTKESVHPGLRPLYKIITGPTARFCCGGAAVLPEPVRIYYERAEGELPDYARFPGGAGDEVRHMAAAGEPAKFGRGSEDVLDPQYRHASKIGAARFGIGGFSPDLLLNDIWRIMAPDAPAGLRAQLHGLSVYGEGGLFKPHADTPRGTTHIGSLVVCLAAPFTGGALAVRHGGVEVSFDWAAAATAASSANADASAEVQWCAFYSDVEHEVLPVISGHRVTLAYDLFIQPAIQELLPLQKPLCTSTLSVLGVLRTLLADPGFYPDGINLGFCCSHRYPTLMDGSRHEPLPEGLKGTDRVLHAAAKALGLEVVLESYCRRDGKSMLAGGIQGGLFDIDEESGDLLAELGFTHPGSDFVWCNKPDDKVRGDIAMVYLAYGNEASIGVLYATSCIIVAVPPYADRKIA